MRGAEEFTGINEAVPKFLVTNIQRMCFHDGPGIRTTVFLKGCNLHCPWCANPENISPVPQVYKIDGKAGVYGKEYTEEELFSVIWKDRHFYGTDGGVTFSGGEPLLWLARLKAVLNGLKERGINVAVETALQVPYRLWQEAIDSIDFFIVDIKILDGETCRSVLGGDAECYRENVNILYRQGKSMLFRIPFNHEYTLKEQNIKLVEEFLKDYRDVPVEIFATHSLGKAKYESLGIAVPAWAEISTDELESVAGRLRKNGSTVRINQI